MASRLSNAEIANELVACSEGDEFEAILYFIENYVQIYDNTSRKWIPFIMWDAQKEALRTIHENQFTIVLKSRQVGLSWVCLAYLLWNYIFRPEVVGLMFSKRETEAIDLLDYRFKNMYKKLPFWMKAKKIEIQSKTELKISNGSRMKASSAGGSDSYAATHCLIDEADLIHHSNTSLLDLLTALEPTVGSAGGKMILISRAEKSRPSSTFKNIYKASVRGENEFAHVFIPWHARPDRTQEWYDSKRRSSLANNGNLDSVFEQYPATAEEALAGSSTDKRFAKKHLDKIYSEFPQEDIIDGLEYDIPNCNIYVLPDPTRRYVITFDAAEGNINSDPSVAVAWDIASGEECAIIEGKLEEDILGDLTIKLAQFYNRAPILPERNNHGSVVIKYIQMSGEDVALVKGLDWTEGSPKFGWKQDPRTKPLMWSKAAEVAKEGAATIHTEAMYNELILIQGSTNRAPEGFHDDKAVNFGLFCAYRKMLVRTLLFAVL